MARFRKEYIELHSDGPYRGANPAINVKVYGRTLSSDRVMEKFGCDEKVAEKALEYAYESNQELFWEEAKYLAGEIFGKGVKVYCEGCSGGWLVVHGLSKVADWDAIMVSKWGYFVRRVKAEMAEYLEESRWLEDIESNRWAEPGAEQYNFLDTKDGKTACVVDIVRIQTEAKVAYLANL
jgi:hypothetical protein